MNIQERKKIKSSQVQKILFILMETEISEVLKA